MTDIYRLILLENDPAYIELIEQELQGSGLKFISRPVQTRNDYLKALLEFSPDIILSAYNLPQMNGFQALQMAKEHSPGVPFILVTGSLGEEKAVEILTGGATDYVAKDRLARLAPAVRRALRESAEHKELKKAEAERDLLFRELETKVRERTAELQAEITEHKRIQQIIDAHLSNSPLAAIEFDPFFRVIFWSPGAERLFGWPPQEILGKSISEVRWIYEEDAAKVRQISSDMVNQRFPSNMHANRNYRKDGTVVYCEWYNSAIYDENGRLSSILSFILDVTERKRAQEILQEREAKLQSILNAAPVGIGVVVNRTFTEVNRTLCEMLGYSEHELLGRNARMIYPSDEAYEYVGTVKYERMKHKGIGTVETQMQLKSGDIIEVLMSSTPIDPHHHEKGITFSVLDITERKLAEKYLQKAKEELENRVRERTAQLARINESLISEIEERKRTETKLRAAQKNLRAMASEVIIAEERSRQHFATDLHDTVVQTLGVAKLRAQLIQDQVPQEAQPMLTGIEEMLSESIRQARSIMAEMSPPVLNELGLVPALEWLVEQIGAQHKIESNFNSKIENISLPREVEVLLFQATRELLMNVVKHSHAKSAAVKFSNSGRKIRVEVSDNGIGFNINKSFQPDLKGGYGLYSIRERLRHISGQLAIKSKPGHGTTVLMLAPREIEK